MIAVVAGCSGPDADAPSPKPQPTTPVPTYTVPVVPGELLELTPSQHLVRSSLTLRGIRPSLAELEQVEADPSAVDTLVDAWLASDDFGETVKDLHAELFLVRADTTYQLPVLGLLTERGYSQADLHHSTVEAPLELVRDVVTTDRPYGEILTADYTLADQVVADIYGLPYDSAQGGWQATHWVDGRPQSGLLSDSEMWRRHTSNAANFHRGRANFISRTFLCEDIGARDVFVEGGVDISDEFAVAHAVSTDPGCVGCHNVLDPLAAFMWGYKEQLERGAISAAYDSDCEWDWSNGEPPRGSYRVEHWCYPLKFYDVSEQDGWETWGLRPPAYFGEPARDVVDLGWMIREDPRFATCTVRNVWSWMSQQEPDDIPLDVLTDLRDVFVDSDQSFKELVRAVVLHDAFRTVGATPASDGSIEPTVGLLSLRPEMWARTMEELTGFVWEANEDPSGCATPSNLCWGVVDIANSDLYGFRSMFGGIDGTTVTHPIHGPTPTKMMALKAMAEEAAGYVVLQDFAVDPAERKLLALVDADTVDEAAVREQLSWLQARILADVVDADSPEVDALFTLWSDANARSGDPGEGWRVVLAALLQDPALVLF